MIHRVLTAALIFCLLLLPDVSLFAQSTTDYLVNWEPNPEPFVTGYVIYRSLNRDTGFTPIDSVDANTHSYLDTGVLTGTRYYYRLIAKGTNGDRSPFSNPVSGITIAQDADNTTKEACRITSMQETTYGSCNVNWSTTGTTVGFIQYDNDATLDSTSTWDNQYSTTHTNPLQNLTVPSTYRMRAVSYDTNDNMIISATSTFDITGENKMPPLPPQDVEVTEISPGCARVTWLANGEPDIGGYTAYYGRLSVPGEAPVYSDSVNAGNVTECVICDFSQGGTFYFAVRAYNTGGEYSAYSEERFLVVDITQPSFTSLFPADGADSVYINTNVSFVVLDSGTGVDSTSVSVRVHGEAPSLILFAGEPESLLVSCALNGWLPANTEISVSVTASDRATFANTDSISWSFFTGDYTSVDTTAPEICCESPPNGAVNVRQGAPITLQISDVGSGIDFAHVYMLINLEPVEFTIEGDHQNAVVRYENLGGFSPGETVNVIFFACDRSSPPNCAFVDDYSFEVEGGYPSLASGEVGAIIPDGFWANDPERPLEVRNLPLNWTVRIFNTAGIQVRSFTNRIQEGFNWTWDDFANDVGNKVARALYLIRITDPSGEVKKSGRFLVQKDP